MIATRTVKAATATTSSISGLIAVTLRAPGKFPAEKTKEDLTLVAFDALPCGRAGQPVRVTTSKDSGLPGEVRRSRKISVGLDSSTASRSQ